MLYSASHSHSVRTIALLAAGAAAAFAGTIPDTETVSLYLNVEKKGNLVTGLQQANFRLYIDGKAHPFRLEKPEEPASIALLVEYSGSSGYFIEDLNAAMQGFLQHAPEGPWYALATFSRGVEINADFTKRIGEITSSYSRLGNPMWNDINTYDAVHEMLDKIGRLPGRRILVIVGCGIDTFSEHTMDQVQKKVEAENVTIFAAGLGSLFRSRYDPYLDSSSRLQFAQAQAFLQMLAKKTGGFAWFPADFNGFRNVMQGIMQSIATQYRLVYEPPPPASGKFQKIKVEAFRVVDDKREDFKVLVREGWR